MEGGTTLRAPLPRPIRNSIPSIFNTAFSTDVGRLGGRRNKRCFPRLLWIVGVRGIVPLNSVLNLGSASSESHSKSMNPAWLSAIAIFRHLPSSEYSSSFLVSRRLGQSVVSGLLPFSGFRLSRSRQGTTQYPLSCSASAS